MVSTDPGSLCPVTESKYLVLLIGRMHQASRQRRHPPGVEVREGCLGGSGWVGAREGGWEGESGY